LVGPSSRGGYRLSWVSHFALRVAWR
jgi:hypothetical protein